MISNRKALKWRSRVHLTSLLDLLFIMIFIALIQPKKASEFEQESVKREIEEPTAVEVKPVEKSTAGEDVFYQKVMVFNEYNDKTHGYISTRTLFKSESGRCFMQMNRVQNGSRMVNEGDVKPMTREEYDWVNDPGVQKQIGSECKVSLGLQKMVINFDSGTSVACSRGSLNERYLCEWIFPYAVQQEEQGSYSNWEPFKVFADGDEQILVSGKILYWTPPEIEQPPLQNRTGRYPPPAPYPYPSFPYQR